MTTENSLCLQYYKNNTAIAPFKPLMTFHKLLLSTYFNLNNLNTYITTIFDIVSKNTIIKICDIIDDIIDMDTLDLKFKNIIENIIDTQNITF